MVQSHDNDGLNFIRPFVKATLSSPLQDFLFQWHRHLTIGDFLRTSANRASLFALGLASVILIFLI